MTFMKITGLSGFYSWLFTSAQPFILIFILFILIIPLFGFQDPKTTKLSHHCSTDVSIGFIRKTLMEVLERLFLRPCSTRNKMFVICSGHNEIFTWNKIDNVKLYLSPPLPHSSNGWLVELSVSKFDISQRGHKGPSSNMLI